MAEDILVERIRKSWHSILQESDLWRQILLTPYSRLKSEPYATREWHYADTSDTGYY